MIKGKLFTYGAITAWVLLFGAIIIVCFRSDNEVKNLQAQVVTLETQYDTLNTKYINDIYNYDKKIENLKSKIDELNYDLVNANELNDELKSDNTYLRLQVEDLKTQIEELEQAKAQKEALVVATSYAAPAPVYENTSDGLTKSGGVYYNDEGHKETWYNLPMGGVINKAQERGIYGEYWVREDGVKMYGDYVIVAGDESKYGEVVETSKGAGIVIDTGTFTQWDSEQYDIAVDW